MDARDGLAGEVGRKTRPPRDTAYALLLAGAYVLLAGGFLASSSVALAAARDIVAVRVECLQAIALVGGTGVLLFVLSRALFRRLAHSAREVATAREALLVADRQATPGLLAASIAHDFNNVLTVLAAAIDELPAHASGPEAREILSDMASAAKRGGELAKRLSRAGRVSASGDPLEVDVLETVRDAVDLVRHHKKVARRTLRLEKGAPVHAIVYPTLVHQVVTNLVMNALDAVADGGTIVVRVRRCEDAVCIEVHDDGPGIPEAERTKLFEPFYTTKAEGTGLGLLSVRTCAKMHRGAVEVGDSDELGGARFRVVLRTPAHEHSDAGASSVRIERLSGCGDTRAGSECRSGTPGSPA